MKRKYGVTLFEKKCRACGAIKPLSDFHRQGEGWKPQCKLCNNAATVAWQRANPEKHRAKGLRWDNLHRDQKNRATRERRQRPEVKKHDREYYKAYSKAHPTIGRLAKKRYWKRYPDKERAHRQRYYKKLKADPVRWRAFIDGGRKWARENPERAAELSRQGGARRRARKRGVLCIAPKDKILARILYYGGRCWICGIKANALDHVKPLRHGGAHVPANLRPICIICNSRKGHKWPFQKEMISSPWP